MEPTPYPRANPILRPDALQSGYSENEIRKLRRNGVWQSLRRGSYLPTDQFKPLSDRERHEILVRTTIKGLRLPAVVSHTSAAVLLGIPLWSTHLGIVHVTRARAANGGRSGQLLCHTATLGEDDITVIDGVQVTSPARTIADLARMLTFDQAIVAADGALYRELTTPEKLMKAAEEMAGVPGSRGALHVARFANKLSESAGESLSRVILYRTAVPEPVLQLKVHNHLGRFVGRTDFAWRDGRLLGEFDGKVKYGRVLKPDQDPGEVIYQEKLREDALRDTGARVVRWVWAELDEPERLADKIRRAIAAVDREDRR